MIDDETEKRKEILERRDLLGPRQSEASTRAALQDEMLILDDDACRATTDDTEALRDIAADAENAHDALLSDDDVDAPADESTTRRKSRRNKKEGTKANDNEISMKLGYNRWMRDNIWVAGEERLAKDNVKQGRFEARQRLNKKITLKKAIEKIQFAGKKYDAFDKEKTVSLPGWTKRMMRKCPDYYS